uniref:NADH-ubiquinone oxidoreductase chain 3 n=1 Tax=Tigriopus californicus TaxID=6832 RepID=A2T4Y7_TIGCA|nr:NADH dehydrogenase subunit 3 [Tigriopus californicus]ABI33099.1 NADH dehydrogenase subunit 3 [Tigriopus californicus]
MLMGWMGVVGGLVGVLSVLGYSVSKKSGWVSVEKSSPFECGFIPSSSARVSFSLHFFLVALIFIVFDVELLLLYPYVVSFSDNGVSEVGRGSVFRSSDCFFKCGMFLGVVLWNIKLKVMI